MPTRETAEARRAQREERRRSVKALLLEGTSQTEIARALGVSKDVVRNDRDVLAGRGEITLPASSTRPKDPMTEEILRLSRKGHKVTTAERIKVANKVVDAWIRQRRGHLSRPSGRE